jgi:hypothetical protein
VTRKTGFPCDTIGQSEVGDKRRQREHQADIDAANDGVDRQQQNDDGGAECQHANLVAYCLALRANAFYDGQCSH